MASIWAPAAQPYPMTPTLYFFTRNGSQLENWFSTGHQIGFQRCCHGKNAPSRLQAFVRIRGSALTTRRATIVPLMKIESLHLNMRVRHPQYGMGTVRRILEHTADIQFDEGVRTVDPETSGLEPGEAQVAVTGLEMPLDQLLRKTVAEAIEALGLDKPDTVVEQLGARWHRGTLLLQPGDRTLQPKDIPVEVFFHKIVMMRNNLRVLEQKINAHPQLSDSEKVDMQQYITRCYGSMTTFNILFRTKADQFGTGEP